MKQRFLLLILCLLVQPALYAQGNKDSLAAVKKDSIAAAKKAATTAAAAAKRVTDTIKTAAATTVQTTVTPTAAVKQATCTCTTPLAKEKEWLLVFSPVILFLVIMVILFFTGLNGFNLKDALTESEAPKTTIQNPLYAAGADIPAAIKDVPPTIEVSVAATYRPSISRYIAFISSMLIIIIGVCMSCFFIYFYIRTGCAPDLTALSAVLLALGIGIIPYAANKVSGAVSSSKKDDY